MTTAYIATHRRQSQEGAWATVHGCTAVATLVAMDQGTRGAKGPAITADAFRARQPDQDGGIDLYDAKIGARSYGVPLEVWASYGPDPAYANLRDHGRATWGTLVSLGHSGRPLVIQGDHDTLPSTLRCAGFLGDHAVMAWGRILIELDNGQTVGRWRVSNPLCPSWVHWTDEQMRAYTGKLAGAGYAYVAAGPETPPARIAGVRARHFWWRYERTATGWRRSRHFTLRGFSSACSAPFWEPVLGERRQMVRLIDRPTNDPGDAYDRYYLDLDAAGVHYREIE